MNKFWTMFQNTWRAAGLEPAYLSWKEISRGLMRDPPGPQLEEELRWDTASKFTLNIDTPWDILRAQLLWFIWCQKVAHTFRDKIFYIGTVLWHAWRNTIYCAMEAYKKNFRYKINEEKRHEAICCFQQIWTEGSVFGRLQNNKLKWNVTSPPEFLPEDLAAWTTPPIRINRLSPSPDLEAEFVARPDFSNLVDQFLQNVGKDWQPAPTATEDESGPATSTNPHYTTAQGDQAQQFATDQPIDGSTKTKRKGKGIKDTNTGNYFVGAEGRLTHAHTSREQKQTVPQPSTQPVSPTNFPTPLTPQVSSPALGTYSYPLSNSISQVSNLGNCFIKAQTGIQVEREQVSKHWTQPVRQSTRSQPRKKCPKRLKHPSRNPIKGTLESPSQAEHIVGAQSHTRTTFEHEQGNKFQDHSAPSHTPKEVVPKGKPKSRPKRKCRFGPRARCLHRDRRLHKECTTTTHSQIKSSRWQ